MVLSFCGLSPVFSTLSEIDFRTYLHRYRILSHCLFVLFYLTSHSFSRLYTNFDVSYVLNSLTSFMILFCYTGLSLLFGNIWHGCSKILCIPMVHISHQLPHILPDILLLAPCTCSLGIFLFRLL